MPISRADAVMEIGACVMGVWQVVDYGRAAGADLSGKHADALRRDAEERQRFRNT